MTDRDSSPGSDGLTRRDRDLIRRVLARYPEVRRVTLFGSRAMGTFGRGSDIDLALEGPGLDARTLTRIATELEDCDLPYKVDLLLRDDQLDPKLEAHIRREGKPFGRRQSVVGDEISLDYGKSTLGDLVYFQRGFDLPAANRETGAFPVIASTGAVATHHTFKVKGPGVVIGRSGSIGGAQFIESDFWPLNTTLWAKDFKGNDPSFVFYFIKNIDFSTLNAGSSVPTLNRNHIHQIAVRFPPDVDEQRAIASVLGALDDKIEQNRRTARALERLARAIFRAWFVDFEPVKAKAARASSFPGMPQPVFDALPTRFVDTDVGPVPKGWGVKALDQCVHLTMGQSPPSEYYNKTGDGLPFHQGVSDFGFRFPKHRVYCTVDTRVAEAYDVLLSVRAPVGRINVADRRLVLGRGLAGLRHLSNRQSFLLHQLGQIFAVEDAVGEGTIYKAVTGQFLSQMLVLSPLDEVQAAFEAIVRPLDELVAAAEVESRNLAEMRDYLLPKLLSGDIRVHVPMGTTDAK